MPTRLLVLLAAILLTSIHPVPARAEPPVRRWAFLIGVDDYAVLKDLEYAAADQRALAGELGRAGFAADQITLLEDKAPEHKYQPSRANILRELNLFLKLPNPQDVVLVGFSGHGVSLGGKSYLCPSEASLEDPSGTMIPIDDVFAGLKACPAAFRLMLVDACRNDPRLDGQRSATPIRAVNDFARSLERPPEGLLLLTSCGRDQVAWEEREFGHGVFMHYVLEGLQGKAADEDGAVRLMRLYDYASDQTKKYVQRKFSAYQSPGFEGRVDGVFELAHVDRSTPVVASVPRPVPSAPEPAPAVDPAPLPPVRVQRGETITNSIGMKLTLIPAGEFLMGSPHGESGRGDDEKLHKVRITRPFYLGTYEVTLGQFLKFYHTANYKARWNSQGGLADGLKIKGGKYDWEFSKPQYVPWSWGHPNQTKDHPVVNVSWNDAVAFCEWLTQQEGKVYRLPTEAEWEYACRAGTTTRFSNGDDEERLIGIGNVADASLRDSYDANYGVQGRDGYPFTAPVGRFEPNGFGLYDMHGNVWEWCADWYDKDYYAASPMDDPRGPSGGSLRVFRGGSWFSAPRNCRSADRDRGVPSYRFSSLGFRVASSPR